MGTKAGQARFLADQFPSGALAVNQPLALPPPDTNGDNVAEDDSGIVTPSSNKAAVWKRR